MTPWRIAAAASKPCRAFLESRFVDCAVTLTGQLFARPQIPSALWFVSKNRGGGHGYRKRTGEALFIEGRKLGTLIPGSRKQRQLSPEEIERIAGVYRQFRSTAAPAGEPGLSAVATVEKIREFGYSLTPGRYVGASDDGGEDEPFEERFTKLRAQPVEQFIEAEQLQRTVREALASFTGV
jgi:type I restriction enzyme M protein